MDNLLSKAERTRNFIIESTAEIFNKQGYAGTSLSDLTGATGLSKGSIYGNFENKEEVALAVFDYNCAKLTNSVNELIDKAHTFHDKLMVYAKVYKSIIRTSAGKGGCPILNTSIDADDTNELLKDRAAKAVLRWQNKIVDIINQGITAGEFHPGVNAKQSALSIIALIEGGVMISKVTGNPANMDSILQTIEMLIHQMKS